MNTIRCFIFIVLVNVIAPIVDPMTANIPPGTFTDIAWSPDGKSIAAIGNRFVVWNVGNGEERFSLETTGTSLSWSPDSSKLVISQENYAAIWNIKDKTLVLQISVPAYASKWSPDGKYILINDQLIEANSGKTIQTIADIAPPFENRKVAWCGDNLAYLSRQGGAAEWNMKSGNRMIYAVHTLFEGNRLNSLSFSPDCNLLAIGKAKPSDAPGTIMIVNTHTCEPLVGNMSPPDVYAVAWSPDRKKLVSSDARNSLTLWSETGGKIKTLERNGAGNLSWAPDSRQFVAILGHGEPEIFTVE